MSQSSQLPAEYSLKTRWSRKWIVFTILKINRY